MIKVLVQDTAADTDALQGTDLERNPGPGILQIYQASTVNTATLTAVMGDENLVRNQVIAMRTNGIPNVDEDQPVIATEVGGGEKNVVNIGGTVGITHTLAQWFDEEEASELGL